MTRKEAREILLGLLFESEFRADESAEDIYYTSAENREIDDDDYIKRAYFAIFEHKVQIDTVIGEHAKGWKTHRLTNISRSILRLAVYEMLYEEGIPHKVSINEAVELTKKYDDEKARSFINGVLNSVKVMLQDKGEGR
ncbi:MAG: transcription antitermination factor NusB [Ruminococcaceae bacterium]|nr:transcription antitermination factor NusB [Oscillospiraceae bacterium]